MVDKLHEIIDKHSELFSHGKPEIYNAFKADDNNNESKAVHKLYLKKIPDYILLLPKKNPFEFQMDFLCI